MKTSSTLLAALALLLLAAPAYAEEPADAFPVLSALDKQLEALPDSWDDRWAAYQDAKDDLAAEREALGPARDAWRKREKGGDEPLTSDEQVLAAQWDAMIPVQTRVATALRRDQLSLGAILMGFFAATLLWGGFAVTTTIAMRSEKEKKERA